MSETTKISVRKSAAKKDSAVFLTSRKEGFKTLRSPVDKILYLQNNIGNQSVQRLFKSGSIQAKLKIGKSNDKYEQEADRVADMVMRMPEPFCPTCSDGESIKRQPEEEEETLQPKPIAEKITPLVQRQEEPEEEEEEPILRQEEEPILRQEEEPILRQEEEPEEEEDIQAKPIAEHITPLVQRQEEEPEKEEEEEAIQPKGDSSSTAEVTPDIESNLNSLKRRGQSLPKSVRNYFEPRFGYDFSGVRVHTDNKASETAKSINAKAFTRGSDIIFNAGQYSPETSEGSHLLAHELTHVVQQNEMRKSKFNSNIHALSSTETPGIVNKAPKNHISRLKVNTRSKTVKDSKDRDVKVTEVITAGECKTKPIPESLVTAGVTSTKAFFGFRYCKGSFAAEGEGSLEYLSGLVDKILKGKDRGENFKKLQEALKKSGPLAGMSLTLRFNSFLAKFEGGAKAGLDESVTGQVKGVLRYSKGKFRVEGIAGYKGLKEGIKKSSSTTLQFNTDIGPVEVRLSGGILSEETSGAESKGYTFKGKVRYRLSPGGMALGGGVEYKRSEVPGRGPSEIPIDQIIFSIDIELGGEIPEVKKPDCFECSCGKPERSYLCNYIKPEPKPEPEPKKQFIYPIFYKYAEAVDQEGKEDQNKRMMKEATDKISEGYFVERIEGRTSPEGPLEKRKTGKFEGNISLAKRRATVAKDRLIESIKVHPLSGVLRMRRNEYLDEAVKAAFPIEGTVPGGDVYTAELFGSTGTGKAKKEVKESDMLKHLLKELAEPKEGEPDKLAKEHVTDKNLPTDVKKEIEKEIEVFRSGKRDKVKLVEKKRLETVYRLFRRALIFLKRKPPKPKKIDLFPKYPPGEIPIPCDDEHKKIFKDVPIPEGWETEGKCSEKSTGG